MTELGRKPRADKGHLRLTQRDRDGMLFIGEQSGVRRDQMPRYLGRHSPRATKRPGEVGATTAQGILERWCALDWVQSVPIYKHEPDWLYLTEKGLRALNLPYHPWTPKRGSQLEHMYWVNEVWLLLEELYPHGRWVSERHIRHTRTMTHYPDAEFSLPNVPKPIAIEVERSLKDSARLDAILPWLAARYENTWYFAVQHDVLVRLRAQREALARSQQERIFLSRYDERYQRWHTDLGQAPPRSRPVELDHGRSKEGRPHAEQPAVSEVLQEIADEWVPPPGHQFGSKRLPPLSPAWMPETFEAAVVVARRLLTPSDEAVLRELRGLRQSEQLREWQDRLQEQLELNVWVTWPGSDNWFSHAANRVLWLACGQRDPEEIVFQLMEEVWWQFQNPPPLRRSRQLVRTESLLPLPAEEWPLTPEAAAQQARTLLSPFEELWLYANKWKVMRRDIKYPSEGWKENLLDQFGLRPPQWKGTQKWNEALWRAAGTAGKAPKEQQLRVYEMLHGVMQQVIRQLEQEAVEQKTQEALAEAQSDESLAQGESLSSSKYQPSLSGCLSLCIKLLGGAGTLIGVGMLALGGKSLHSLVLDSTILLLGLGVFVLGVYLARHGKSSSKFR